MFTIIISEKGGVDRREAFDRTEINVGRVQGNDLMLAKGNVSKHHARLLFRDGRFIVTDLKSTNGTYVNGRKISQATIVREGDKIYVGDFVLRLETGAASADSTGDNAAARPSGRASASGRQPVSSQGPAPNSPVVAVAPVVAVPPPGSPPPSRPERPAERQSSVSHISHFPLEREPDSESAPDLLGGIPPAPRVARADSSGSHADSTGPQSRGAPVEVSSVARLPEDDGPGRAELRRTLVALMDRLAETIDLRPLTDSPVVDEKLSKQLEAAVLAEAAAMRARGEIAGENEVDEVTREALRELLGLGPLGPLLDDGETSEVFVGRHDAVVAAAAGHRRFVVPGFTSEDALARVVARLAHQSGTPLRPGESVVSRRLPSGAEMTAVQPPLASGWALTLRKSRRVQTSLDDLVRARAVSSAMAVFLAACIEARANVLVVGSGTAAVTSTLAALSSVGAVGERVAILGDSAEIAVGDAIAIRLSALAGGADGEDAVHAAMRLGADRLVVTSLAGRAVAATVEAIGAGCEGVIVGVIAPSLRHALARVPAQLAMARPGVGVEVAREAVGEAFDVAVELSRAGDGRLRVLRVAEFAGADVNGVVVRDLFLSTGSKDTEAAGFVATGARSRLTQEFAARGIKVDDGIFKKSKP